MSCLGDVVAALVDGELDHAARERAQRHLAHCTPCRTEVDAQRRLKARLTGTSTGEVAPSDALTARLLGLRPDPATGPAVAPQAAVPQATAAGTTVGWRVQPRLQTGPRPARPGTSRAATAGPGAERRRRPSLRRSAAVGSALAVLGAALVLGGPQATPATTPVDPVMDASVVDFGTTTTGTTTTDAGSSTAGVAGGGRSQR